MSKKKTLGVGLDIGTMNIVSARSVGGSIETKRMRDAFMSMPPNKTRMLKLSETSFVEREHDVLLLGDAAMEMANVFGGNPRRPLAGGLIAAGESDALGVLKLLIKNVLGEPQIENEVCYFSVPAAPLDQPGKDIIYHRGVFERIVEECGFEPYPANEAMGIIFSECAAEGFSGLSFSFGSGMTNVALALNTTEVLSFSVQRGGDWIDEHAAQAVGMTQAQMCALKESGIDLMTHETQPEEALTLYYKAMIDFALDQVAAHFVAQSGQFTFPKPIPIIVSGGTSMAGGFIDFFNKVWRKKKRKFPIEVSEIRSAKDPLNAVAFGMLIQSMQEYEE
mgnify:CR=1 FL=1|jgi:hypothetical protein